MQAQSGTGDLYPWSHVELARDGRELLDRMADVWGFDAVRQWGAEMLRTASPDRLDALARLYGCDALGRWGPDRPEKSSKRFGAEAVKRWGPSRLDAAARRYGDDAVRRCGPEQLERLAERLGAEAMARLGPEALARACGLPGSAASKSGRRSRPRPRPGSGRGAEPDVPRWVPEPHGRGAAPRQGWESQWSALMAAAWDFRLGCLVWGASALLLAAWGWLRAH